MSAQLAPQAVVPATQPHAPAAQIWRAPQVRPHPPQFAGSSVTSVHAPPHTSCAPGQTQAPARHAPISGQMVAHAPQFTLSRLTSTQLAPHAASGGAQLVAHVPRVQTWPAAHARPHPPQFAASALTSTHLPAQDVVPVRQTQAPRAHS